MHTYISNIYHIVYTFLADNFSLDSGHFTVGIVLCAFILSVRGLTVYVIHKSLYRSLHAVGYAYEDRFKEDLSNALKKLLFICALWAFFNGVTKTGALAHFILGVTKSIVIFYTCYVAFIFQDILNHLINHWTKVFDRGDSFDLRSLWTTLYRVLVILIGIITFLETWGYDTTRLVASFGILGAAVALSAKQSLEDIFGSFTIYAVHAFKRGDRVKIGKVVDGVIEHFGLRATLIRSDDGNLNYVPNQLVASSMITNCTESNAAEDYSFTFPVEIPLTYNRKNISGLCRAIEQGLKDIKGLDQSIPPRVVLTDMTDKTIAGKVSMSVDKKNAAQRHDIQEEALLILHEILLEKKVIVPVTS